MNIVAPGMQFAGQARTIGAVAGDNAAMHVIITMLRPGEVLVIDAENYDNRAVWGGILNSRAMLQKINGVIVDGAVRDIAELREMPLPVFASASCPAGPHKGWGGSIDNVISCGGVSVTPGDIVLADDDGVTVVPLARAHSVLVESQKKVLFEAQVLQKLATGEDTSKLFPLPDIPLLKRVKILLGSSNICPRLEISVSFKFKKFEILVSRFFLLRMAFS